LNRRQIWRVEIDRVVVSVASKLKARVTAPARGLLLDDSNVSDLATGVSRVDEEVGGEANVETPSKAHWTRQLCVLGLNLVSCACLRVKRERERASRLNRETRGKPKWKGRTWYCDCA
jgi:hypothetical protein